MRKQRRSRRELELDGDQREMLKAFDKMRLKGKGSGKFNGDVCCRILQAFLAKELCPGFKVSEPNAYILGDPQERDLLILASNARPIRHTNAFDSESVKCGIEVKANGTGFTNDPLADVRKQKDVFIRSRKKFRTIKNVYFTFQESTPKRRDAIDYWKLTRKGLKPFRAFCLRNRRGRTQEPWLGEWGWEGFVEYIGSIL
jgi:hypothetical protein